MIDAVLKDPAILNAGVYIVAAFAGQIFFAVKLWAGKQIECVWDRFGDDPRASVAAVISNITVMVGVVAILPLDTMPLSACLLTGFLQGISADSTLNKSERRQWSEAERQAAGAKP